MKWFTLLLVSALALPVEAKREELPPLPDNMCALITIELLKAVEEGTISEDTAEAVGGRCFRIWGDYFRGDLDSYK